MTNAHLEVAYQQLCESYRSIDDMRMKLLAALPLATGTGIFLLLNKDSTELLQEYSSVIGVFGFLITVGLALYEAYGIRKCHALISTGREIEKQLDVPGQFLTRPDPLFGFVNERLAAAFIYPAVLAAWTFMALYTSRRMACWAALLVFSFGLVLSLVIFRWFRDWRPPQLDKWIDDHLLG